MCEAQRSEGRNCPYGYPSEVARIFEASTVPFPIHGELLDITPEDLREKPNFEWEPNAAYSKGDPKKTDNAGSLPTGVAPKAPENAPEEAQHARTREQRLRTEPATGAASSFFLGDA